MAAKKSAAKRSGGTSRARSPVLVVVDDIGNLAKTAKNKTRSVFGFGVSVVKDPDKYAQVSNDYKVKNGIKGEFKAKDVDRLRDKIALSYRIRRSGAKNYGYYVDKKKDTPQGWKEQKGGDAQVGALHRSIDLTLSKIKAKDVTVVVDDHSAYHTKEESDRVKPMSKILSKKHGKNVTVRTGGKKNDPNSAHLQTVDAVSHAIYERKEECNPTMAATMGLKLRRLTKKDDVNAK